MIYEKLSTDEWVDIRVVLGTYLSIRNDSELPRSRRIAGQSSVGNLSRSADGRTGRNPVANLIGDDFNQAHSRIVLRAVVFPIFKIAEER